MTTQRIFIAMIFLSALALSMAAGQTVNPHNGLPMLAENTRELKMECSDADGCTQEEYEEAYDEDDQEQEEMREPAITTGVGITIRISDFFSGSDSTVGD